MLEASVMSNIIFLNFQMQVVVSFRNVMLNLNYLLLLLLRLSNHVKELKMKISMI